MQTNIFIKVEVEHDQAETPEQIAGRICRQIAKVYGVRSAELQNFIKRED